MTIAQATYSEGLVLSKVRRLLRPRAVRSFVRTCYSVLRLIVPTNPKQIGFVSTPDLTDNSMALYETLMKDPRAHQYRIVWLVADASASEEFLQQELPSTELGKTTILVKNSVRGFWGFLRSRIVFATHGIYDFAHSGHHQIVCNLWHGMPIKTIGAHDGKSRDDLMFMQYSIATSSYFADLIAKSFYLPPDNVLVTGLPRNDWLLQTEEKYHACKEDRARLVVWLPTYRASCVGELRKDSSAMSQDPLSVDTLAMLDEMLEDADVMLVVKLHFMDIKNSVHWPSFKNIRVYNDLSFRSQGLNLYKLLACSSALVTDYSSCAVDYMLLNRPIGLFAPDISFYTRGFMPDVLEKVAAVGYQLSSVQELAAFVRDHLHEGAITPEQEVLHKMDLRSPSKAILRAFSLIDDQSKSQD